MHKQYQCLFLLSFQVFGTPSACSTPASVSTLSPSSSFDDEMASPQYSQAWVPKLKRTRPREFPVLAKKAKCSLLGENFKLPISSKIKQCVKDNTPLDDANRRQLIRDCVTYLEAHVDCMQLTSEHFTEVAKQLCESVPLLCDEKPIHWPDNIEFQYWVIWIIIFLTTTLLEILRLCWREMQNTIGL